MKHPQLYITWWCVEDLGWANIDSVDLVDENQHNLGNILIYFLQYWRKSREKLLTLRTLAHDSMIVCAEKMCI